MDGEQAVDPLQDPLLVPNASSLPAASNSSGLGDSAMKNSCITQIQTITVASNSNIPSIQTSGIKVGDIPQYQDALSSCCKTCEAHVAPTSFMSAETYP
jgi:hypothetical protein